MGPRCAPLSADVPPGGAAALAELLRTADVLLLTEEEAACLTGCASAEASAEQLLAGSESADPWVCIKLGGAGCLAVTRGESVALPAIRVRARDTVGCGDSFAAAVALGRTRGEGLRATLALANAVGAATATGRGAGRNVASAAHVRELLVEQEGAGEAALALLDGVRAGEAGAAARL